MSAARMTRGQAKGQRYEEYPRPALTATKRPPNPFIIFRSAYILQLRLENPEVVDQCLISEMAGQRWFAMTAEEKQSYAIRAQQHKVKSAQAEPCLAGNRSPFPPKRTRIKKGGRGHQVSLSQSTLCNSTNDASSFKDANIRPSSYYWVERQFAGKTGVNPILSISGFDSPRAIELETFIELERLLNQPPERDQIHVDMSLLLASLGDLHESSSGIEVQLPEEDELIEKYLNLPATTPSGM